MMQLNGKRVITGTGEAVWPEMYTVAKLDEHLGDEVYCVFKQTNSSVSALMSYMDLREIWGNEAQIVIIRPGELAE